jgi:CelD/BcsL family acetyltransferase involved in cellulose biosynthesis
MQTRAISIRDLSPADERAWRDLAARSVEPNPFFEADFLVPACRHLRNGKGVVLLVAEDSGRFHACLPVRPIRLPGSFNPPVISSWQHPYGYLGTPLADPERGVEALSSLLATLRGTGPWPRVVVLELFGDDGPIASYLRRAARELGLALNVHAAGERAVFRCQDDEAGLLSSGFKREQRAKARQWRRLCRDVGDPSVVDRAGDRDSSKAFLAMEASGWKGKAGTALACRAGDAEFYREVTDRFGAAGRLRLYSLEAGGRELAMQTNLCASDVLFGWKVAYDERFANYGPGVQLQLRVMELAWQDGMRWVDSCAGVGNYHQLRLAPDRRRVATLAIRGDRRMESGVLPLAVLLVQMGGKLRGLSARTLRHKLAGAVWTTSRLFYR